MTLGYAQQIAGEIRARLVPHCLPGRCVVAGSTRRRKPLDIHDIEIVCIPKTVPEPTLFGEPMPVRDPAFCAALDGIGPKVLGDAHGKMATRWIGSDAADDLTGDDPVKLDCFMATPENWGLILAIRTGSADWCAKRLMTGLRARGIACRDGAIRRVGFDPEGRLRDDEPGEPLDASDEREVLALAGIPWTEPEDRTA